ncbi:ATP-binding protein [Methanobacterium oryzae]|uniref:ATP-binding protein n=1 Tax=Methanobacterium oryzae TaxID=69540 RepID=UPI003D22FD1D
MDDQNNQYSEIFEKSPIGILFYDKEGKLVDANQSALKIARVSKFEDIRGINLFVNPFIESRKEELLKNGIIRFQSSRDLDTAEEYGFYTATESGIIYIDYTISVTDSGFLMQIQDISEQKKAQEELQKSNEKFQSMLESSRDVIYRINRQRGRFEYISPFAEKIVGFSIDELMALDIQATLEMIHPDDRHIMQTALTHLEDTGEAHAEYRQQTKNGGYRWISNYMSITKDDAGKPLYHNGNIRDITERKKDEDHFCKEVEREGSLLELYKKAPKLADKELYKCALDLTVKLTDSTIGFFHMISDDQKNIIITAWNNEAWNNCKASFKNHYPIEESGNWTDCIQAKRPIVYNDYENSPNRKGFPKGHTPVKRFISTPVFDEDKVKFIFGVGNKVDEYDDRDVIQIQSVANELYRIIKQRQSEQALKEAHNNLELKVQERTKELEKVINELERSNQELQQFAYVSSHDLQEPLRTIASFTQLLQHRYTGKFDSDADEFMEYIVEAAIRMKAQIEGLLEYSRVGTQGKEFEPVDMNLKLNYVIHGLNALIKDSNAEITSDELPVVKGDSSQLQIVFQNLISNAIRFRKCEEPLKIQISTQENQENKEYVFSVQDNGIGIEEQYSERIFTIFQRLHTRKVYKGTGIGLSIVKRIIERHGGRVWVESEFGVGSTFYFTIPIMKSKK